MSEVDHRVSTTERDDAVVLLREAHVAGRLTLEEFSERVELAYAARTRLELARTTGDLPIAPAPSRKRRRRFALALFGRPTMRGRWRASRRFLAIAVFGGVDLDLREVQLAGDRFTIFSLAVFGNNNVYVPEGIEVDLLGFAVFGCNEEHGREGDVHAGSPLIRIHALSILGRTDAHHLAASSGNKIADFLRRAVQRGLAGPPPPRGTR